MKRIILSLFITTGILSASQKTCAVNLDPHDIAVKADVQLQDATAQAMDYWSKQTGLKWHYAKDFSGCMLYLKYQMPRTMPRSKALGYGHEASGFVESDTTAVVSDKTSWRVVAHEVGHLLGYSHTSSGLMAPVLR